MDAVTLALAKMYTDKVFSGAGTIKGKNCTIKEYLETDNAVIVTFQWTADDGTAQTTDVPISYEKIAELVNIEAKAEFKTLELDIATADGVTYTAENLSETFAELKAHEADGYKLLAVGKLSDGSKICLNLLETSDTKLTFTGCDYKDGKAKIYTLEMTETATSVSIQSVSGGGGSEAFTFTFTFELNGSENPISNLSSTYDEIKAAIDGGMIVYGVGNAYGYMYMQFTPAVWADGTLVFSTANPDGGLPYLLMIDSSGNGVVQIGGLESDVFSVHVYTGILEDGTRFIDCDRSYDEINGAFGTAKSIVCKLNVSEQDGTRYDVSLYTRSRVDGTIVFSGKAAPQGVENEYTLTIKYTGEKTLDIAETDEKLREAVKTANNYTDEQIEKLSTAEALSVDEKPLYEDGEITYIKDGVTHTLEDGETWFYYRDADGALLQTIWIDGTEYTIKAGDIDLTEYLKKTSVVMPKENISDPDPEYKAEDVPSMALLEKLLAENGGGGGGGNPVGTVIAFSGLIPPEGYLLCDGAEVKREDYADLFSVIGELYGAGDGSTTFNLPNLTDRFVQGVGTNTLGTTMEAGLPNINAQFEAANYNGSSNSGAVHTSRRDQGAAEKGTASGFGEDTYYFDASKSNAIYGKSTTVQPPAVVMTYIIRAVAGEVVDNDYVAGEGIAINTTVVDGKEKLEISSKPQEFLVLASGVPYTDSDFKLTMDSSYSDIENAISLNKTVVVKLSVPDKFGENSYALLHLISREDKRLSFLGYAHANEILYKCAFNLSPGTNTPLVTITNQSPSLTFYVRWSSQYGEFNVSLSSSTVENFSELLYCVMNNIPVNCIIETDTGDNLQGSVIYYSYDKVVFSATGSSYGTNYKRTAVITWNSDDNITSEEIVEPIIVHGNIILGETEPFSYLPEIQECDFDFMQLYNEAKRGAKITLFLKEYDMYGTYQDHMHQLSSYSINTYPQIIFFSEIRDFAGTDIRLCVIADEQGCTVSSSKINNGVYKAECYDEYGGNGVYVADDFATVYSQLSAGAMDNNGGVTTAVVVYKSIMLPLVQLTDDAMLFSVEHSDSKYILTWKRDNTATLDIDENCTRNFERRQKMPTGADDDLIRPDFLYVDESKGATDEEAALLKRYAPELSSAADGFLRYLPVDRFVKTFDALTLLSGLTVSGSAPQGFIIADSLLYLQGYFKTSKTFSSSGWNIISEFDLATIGYEWAGLEEGLPIRTLVSVWLDNAYVNSCISIYNVTGSPSTGNFSFYVTNALVDKAIAFNLNVMLPVRKKR